MVDSQHSFTLQGGTTIDHAGLGLTPDAAIEMTELSITGPAPGNSGQVEDGHWDNTHRLYCTFTPETTGQLYIAAWPSHWVDAEGNVLEQRPQVELRVANQVSEWGDPKYQSGYNWESYGTLGHIIIDAVADTRYWLSVNQHREYDYDGEPLDPPIDAAEVHLVVFLSAVQEFTPWKAEPDIPLVYRDRRPHPEPADLSPRPEPEPPQNWHTERDARIGRRGTYFVGRH